MLTQATQERAQALHSEQDMYRDVTDLSSLLLQLNLEHYQSCFEQEEVDLATFLTMTEVDLKEVGVSTLGARRKLQIAISGVWGGGVLSHKKLQITISGGSGVGMCANVRPGGRCSQEAADYHIRWVGMQKWAPNHTFCPKDRVLML